MKPRIFIALCFTSFILTQVILATAIVMLSIHRPIAWFDFGYVVLTALIVLLSTLMLAKPEQKKALSAVDNKKESQAEPIYHAPTFENYQQLQQLMSAHKKKFNKAQFHID